MSPAMERDAIEEVLRTLAREALKRSADCLEKGNDHGAKAYADHAATLLAAIEPVHLLAPSRD